jgi:hypothetical protein
MLLTKLNEMSIGPLWKLRDRIAEATLAGTDAGQATHPDVSVVCATCMQSWLQFDTPDARILAVTSAPISDEVQLKLMQNCLAAAGWDQQYSLFSLHGLCQENAEIGVHALKAQMSAQNPDLILVFGSTAAQLMHKEFAHTSNQLLQFNNVTLLVTHHPAEMIATPKLKAQVWADLCLLKQTLASSH